MTVKNRKAKARIRKAHADLKAGKLTRRSLHAAIQAAWDLGYATGAEIERNFKGARK